MKKARKIISIALTLVMLMQFVPVMASGMTVTDLTWGDGWTYGAPTFNASAEGMTVITLYKDGKEVDSTWYYVDDWEARDITVYMFYAYKMVDLGAGVYHYTVSPYNEATDDYYATYTSPTFNYNPPAKVAAKPVVTYDGNKLNWDVSGDEASFGVVGYLTYGDGVYYDLVLYEKEMSDYTIEDADRQLFEETAQLWYESDPALYPIKNARFVWAVYAVPYDRTQMEMSKSDYVDVTEGSVVNPPSGGGEVSGSGYLYWDETTFGEICYSGYAGSEFHKIVLDNGTNTYSQTRSTSEEETDFTLRMSSSIARMGSGTYIPTITYYVSRADQTVLHTVTGPGLTYTEPTATFNIRPTVSGGDGYVQFGNYDEVYDFFYWPYIEYSHTGERVALYGQSAPIFLLEEDGKLYFDEYVLNNYNSKLEAKYAEDPVKYNKANARMVLDVTAYAKDINKYKPYQMGEVVVYIDGSSTGGDTDDVIEPVDRTSVSEAYYDGAKVMYDLGIMPDVYKTPQATLTKGDFAIALTALLGGTETAAAMQNTQFCADLEVGTVLNGCAQYLNNMGILPANDYNSYGADTEILYENIIKALVSSLGYDVLAQNYGGYPSGYLYVASRYQIAKGVNLSTGSTVTTEQLAQLFYNALEVGFLEQTSWGYEAKYEVTNNTLLYDNLGFTKALGTLSVNGNMATIDGRAYDIANLTGRFDKYKNLEVLDADLKALNGKGVKLYVKDNKAYSGFEYYGGEVIINDGAAETENPTVKVQVIGYSYTKYKVGDGEYKPLPADAFDYTFDTKDGKKTLSVTFATDDESKATTVNSSIQFNNKRTITYMVNGEKYETKEVGVGSKIYAITNPTITGYKFNGWKGFPADMIMPDRDLVITADVTKLIKVTGVLMYNGAPLAWANVRDVRDGYMYNVATPDSTGAFTAYLEPGERMLQIDATYASATYSTPLTVGTKDIDLGTIVLDNTSTYAIINDASVKSVAIPDEVISAEDEAYVKQSSNNSVYVTVSVSNGGYVKDFENVVKEQYPEYEAVVNSLSVNVSKQKRGAESTRETLEETNALVGIKVEIPEDLQHKSDFLVLRKHGDEVQVLTTTPNADGEYVKIDGRYATIYAKKFSNYALAGTGLRFTKIYNNAFEYTDKKIVEVSLGSLNNIKAFVAEGMTIYYNEQRGVYIGVVNKANLGEDGRAVGFELTDATPLPLVYGNIDGNYNYTDIENAVKNGDLTRFKFYLAGLSTMDDRSLLAADVNGDGRVANGDLMYVKRYLSLGEQFPIVLQ